jgi:hypothetical protein
VAGFAFEPEQLPVGAGAAVGAAFDPLQLLCVEVSFVVTPVPPLLPVQLLSALPIVGPSARAAPAIRPAIPNPAKYFLRSWVSIIHLLSFWSVSVHYMAIVTGMTTKIYIYGYNYSRMCAITTHYFKSC